MNRQSTHNLTTSAALAASMALLAGCAPDAQDAWTRAGFTTPGPPATPTPTPVDDRWKYQPGFAGDTPTGMDCWETLGGAGTTCRFTYH